jgi:hypothetical protein
MAADSFTVSAFLSAVAAALLFLAVESAAKHGVRSRGLLLNGALGY